MDVERWFTLLALIGLIGFAAVLTWMLGVS
jgi:hypothetical protein